MSINIAVVPVAGLGTRLLPATKSQPKEMLPVGRKPVVQYVVDELTRGGIDRILFITGPGKTSIENHFDINAELIQMLRETGKEELLSELSFERVPTRYFFTRQRRLLGLGHAISCASSFVGDQPFVVALGDSIIGMNAQSDVVQRMTECYRRDRRGCGRGLRGGADDRGPSLRRRQAKAVRRCLRIGGCHRKTVGRRGPQQPGHRRSLRPGADHLRAH